MDCIFQRHSKRNYILEINVACDAFRKRSPKQIPVGKILLSANTIITKYQLITQADMLLCQTVLSADTFFFVVVVVLKGQIPAD